MGNTKKSQKKKGDLGRPRRIIFVIIVSALLQLNTKNKKLERERESVKSYERKT